jgi:hypothetical protein
MSGVWVRWGLFQRRRLTTYFAAKTRQPTTWRSTSRSTVETLGRQKGVETEWRCIKGPASDSLPQHARYADLCVVGHHPAADNALSDYSLSEKLLFVTGRPVLFIPAAAERFSSNRGGVEFEPSRCAIAQ